MSPHKKGFWNRREVTDIERFIGWRFGFKKADIVASNRNAEYNEARGAWWYLLSEKANCAATHIGRMFERDHSTVLYSVKRLRGSGAAETLEKSYQEFLLNHPAKN